MTVVLLDPRRPEVVPLRAVQHLAGPVEATPDVPASIRDFLDVVSAADTLVAVSDTHPQVSARLVAGETLIAADGFLGFRLLESVDLMDDLRTRGPWEREQTHESLQRYLLEETYELLDAVRAGDRDELRKELGDMLLQVLFHARIAEDDPADPFTLDDVAAALTAKLLHRNPPHFGTDDAPMNAEEQNQRWQERKAAEKPKQSLTEGIPLAQPALALAEKVLGRAAEAGIPSDLIPEALVQVSLQPQGNSELTLREAVLDLIETIVATEKKIGRSVAEPEKWRAAWEGTLPGRSNSAT
ncbi:MazG family protein [Hoyosella subflava]|uniref:Nucleoside triphosphate pyrophosphohydrolase n=1 Tax=Hoyosella subflava (strain DSM 45089 / JCM 17490 / NBRC 109087 / DQS3-9A1) TaxID=443218 RepID=F6EQP1_HOYSD|nr:MazG family protein [Hoyosella subflava]AEF41918.1 Nucleoside triphosphate pyrophosphohydrolase [Hoyosella subflava DQS3-9A1]